MPLPATRTVTGLYTNPGTGAPATGTVTFSPVPTEWTDTDGNQVLVGSTTVTLVGGAFSQQLVPTDTPGVMPTNGKLWMVEERLTGLASRIKHFALASGASSIDITDLVPVDPEPPEVLPEGTAGGDLIGAYPSPQLRNWQTGRDHLGLGSSATRDVGVGLGQVADGEPNALSTGLVSGGDLSLNANPKAVSISALVGYVVDYITNPSSPSVVRVSAAAQTVLLDAAALTRTLTWWMMDATGAVIQQAGEPTFQERRTRLVLGFTAYSPVGGLVFTAKATPVALPQLANQLADLMDAIGVFNINNGNAISAAGASLSFAISSGSIFSRAFNYSNDRNNPHIKNTPAQNPALHRHALRGTTDFGPAPVTTLDPANYDLNGVLTPVGGGTNVSTVQRVYMFAQDDPQNQLVVQYGQTTYPSLAAAEAAIATQPFVVNPAFVGVLLGYIVMIHSATDLSDPAQAKFVQAPRFSGTGG